VLPCLNPFSPVSTQVHCLSLDPQSSKFIVSVLRGPLQSPGYHPDLLPTVFQDALPRSRTKGQCQLSFSFLGTESRPYLLIHALERPRGSYIVMEKTISCDFVYQCYTITKIRKNFQSFSYVVGVREEEILITLTYISC
jgi:hypothetical protein